MVKRLGVLIFRVNMVGKRVTKLPSECFFSLDLTTVQKASQLLYGESTSGVPEGLSKTVININNTIQKYGKCPKISYTNIYDKMAYANSADPDQNEEQSDQGLYCLPFH